MWRTAAAAVVLITALSACQSSSTASVTSPSPSPSAAATPSPSPLPTVAGFVCRLPISDGTPGSGGFITFPGGQFTPDPNTDVSVPGPAAGGRKTFGLTYDKRYQKWLPVPYDWVSPDGSKYVYPTGTALAVVNASTGKLMTTLTKGEWAYWWPVDVESNGVWAWKVYDSTVPAPESGGPGALWLWTFSGGGSTAPLTTTYGSFQYAVRGSIGYDYGSWVKPGDPAGSSLGRSNYSNGQGTIILRADLDHQYVWIGVASDTVFVELTGGNIVAIKGDDRTQTPVDLRGDLPLTGVGQYSVLGDSHGIWIAGKQGLYLMTPIGVFKASDHTGVLAGGCA